MSIEKDMMIAIDTTHVTIEGQGGKYVVRADDITVLINALLEAQQHMETVQRIRAAAPRRPRLSLVK